MNTLVTPFKHQEHPYPLSLVVPRWSDPKT
jgi:hypothetical protein